MDVVGEQAPFLCHTRPVDQLGGLFQAEVVRALLPRVRPAGVPAAGQLFHFRLRDQIAFGVQLDEIAASADGLEFAGVDFGDRAVQHDVQGIQRCGLHQDDGGRLSAA